MAGDSPLVSVLFQVLAIFLVWEHDKGMEPAGVRAVKEVARAVEAAGVAEAAKAETDNRIKIIQEVYYARWR